MNQLDPITGLPVQPEQINQMAQPEQVNQMVPPVPLPAAPNYAPINPNAISAVGAVKGVFGENTEGQYGRPMPNTQQI